jgi:hypothetical protein
VYLSWQQSFFDGGSEIIGYTIYYTIIEKIKNVAKKNTFKETIKKIKIKDKNITNFVIRNLLPKTELKNITITAINKQDLISEHSVLKIGRKKLIKNLKTLKSSRFVNLNREILLTVENKNNEWIDSDFFTVLFFIFLFYFIIFF